MNTPRLFATLAACLLTASPALADNEPQPPPSAPLRLPGQPEPPPEHSVFDSHWNIRADLLVVDLPQAKALGLVPDLQDPAKIDAAVTQIMTAVDHGEATFIGHPVLQVIDGERGTTQPVSEKRYPTEYEPASSGTTGRNFQPPELRDASLPTAFETRNAGLSFEINPNVTANGSWVYLDVLSNRVILLGSDEYITKIKQPKFVSLRTDTTLAIPNGQRTLLAFHKVPESDNLIEINILRAIAVPIK